MRTLSKSKLLDTYAMVRLWQFFSNWPGFVIQPS